jgi:hypothetical protein
VSDEGGFQIFYVSDGEASEPGPRFTTLAAALDHAKLDASRRCDIRLPNGGWYGRQKTVGATAGEEGDVERARKIAAAARQEAGWMEKGPGRRGRS